MTPTAERVPWWPWRWGQGPRQVQKKKKHSGGGGGGAEPTKKTGRKKKGGKSKKDGGKVGRLRLPARQPQQSDEEGGSWQRLTAPGARAGDGGGGRGGKGRRGRGRGLRHERTVGPAALSTAVEGTGSISAAAGPSMGGWAASGPPYPASALMSGCSRGQSCSQGGSRLAELALNLPGIGQDPSGSGAKQVCWPVEATFLSAVQATSWRCN